MEMTVVTGDMAVSDNPEDILITYSLGSCIGVAIYDPVVKVGGLLHFMLPDSSISGEKADSNPYMFADTGIPLLFKKAYQLGAEKARILVKLAGGSQLMDEKGVFNIGRRNHAAARKIFWKNNVLIDAEDVGGNAARTLYLHVATGKIRLRISGNGEREL
jgi:chemotaxis protein CheD